MHNSIPTTKGRTIARIVFFILFVSFFIEKHVVEHGKWNNVNIIKQTAVTTVHPFDINNMDNSLRLLYSARTPVPLYIIRIMGRTISLAGNPSMKAVIMVPSRPINTPKGSKKFVTD